MNINIKNKMCVYETKSSKQDAEQTTKQLTVEESEDDDD